MRTAGVFIVNIEPETAASPTRLSIALSGAVSTHCKMSWTLFEPKRAASLLRPPAMPELAK
jgi:hypothetical protein